MSVVATPAESLVSGAIARTGVLSSMASTAWEVAGSAEPPKDALSLNPLKAGGLWLAVIITPPMAFRVLTAYETAGVGVGLEVSTTSKSLAANTSAVRRAN